MPPISGSGTPNTQGRSFMAIAPISASTTQTSTGVPVVGFGWALVKLFVGTMATNATIDLSLEGCDTLGGTYSPIAGAVMAQRVAASHASKVYYGMIELGKRPKTNSGLDVKFIRAVAACATAASLIAVEIELSNPDRTERVTGDQLASSPIAIPIGGSDALFSI